mgnify:CR=1 FL=1
MSTFSAFWVVGSSPREFLLRGLVEVDLVARGVIGVTFGLFGVSETTR